MQKKKKERKKIRTITMGAAGPAMTAPTPMTGKLTAITPPSPSSAAYRSLRFLFSSSSWALTFLIWSFISPSLSLAQTWNLATNVEKDTVRSLKSVWMVSALSLKCLAFYIYYINK